MTPFEIGILLHYYALTDDHASLLGNLDTSERLTCLGLIRRDTEREARHYELTARGSAYVEALLRVPLPVAVWVMPDDPGTPLGEATSLYTREG